MTDAAYRRHRALVRATPDKGPGSFEAKVSTYNLDYDIGWGWTERILSGCFAESIAAHPVIPVWFSHQWRLEALLGDAAPSENDDNLTVAGQLWLGGDPAVAKAYKGMQQGLFQEWSIGFWPETIINDKDNPRCDQIAKGDLAEVSLCLRGANTDTGTVDLSGRVGWIDGPDTSREAEVMRLRRVFNVGADLAHSTSGTVPAATHLATGAMSGSVTHTHTATGCTCGWNRGATGEGVSEAAWDGSAARFDDDQYKTACAVCRGDDPDHPKQDCSLPHHEPDGRVSRAGVHAAAGRVGQADLTDEQRAAAKAHLRSHYTADLDETPPDSLSADSRAAYEPEPYSEKDDETVRCPSCEKYNDTDARYCDQCGFKLIGADNVTVDARDSGHTHDHKHGDTVHSHAHTHSGGNYDHDGSDLEVVHAHAHDSGGAGVGGTDEDPGPDESDRARRLAVSGGGRRLLALARKDTP